jgi:hypothetical protein
MKPRSSLDSESSYRPIRVVCERFRAHVREDGRAVQAEGPAAGVLADVEAVRAEAGKYFADERRSLRGSTLMPRDDGAAEPASLPRSIRRESPRVPPV